MYNHYQPPFEYTNGCRSRLANNSIILVFRFTHTRYLDAPLIVFHNKGKTIINGRANQYWFRVKELRNPEYAASFRRYVFLQSDKQTPQRYDEVQETNCLPNNGGIIVRD